MIAVDIYVHSSAAKLPSLEFCAINKLCCKVDFVDTEGAG